MKNFWRKTSAALFIACAMCASGETAAQTDFENAKACVTVTADDTSRGVADNILTARAELRDAIDALIIENGVTLGEYERENEKTKLRLDYMLESMKPTDEKKEDGKLTQSFCINLFGVNKSVLNAVVFDHKGGLPIPDASSEYKAAMGGLPDAGLTNDEGQALGYSGLVIDCLGLKGAPVLLPSIVDETGRVLYSKDNFDQGELISRGLANYITGSESFSPKSEADDAAKDEAADKIKGEIKATDERAGKYPFIVKAVAVEGSKIVITKETADKLLYANSTYRFLDGAKVTILLGE